MARKGGGRKEKPGASARVAPNTGGIRGYSPEQQAAHPMMGGAADATDRVAEAEEAAAEAHAPLGPGGYVEPREVSGGPATPLIERDPPRNPWVESEDDILVEGPETGPVMNVLPPPIGPDEELFLGARHHADVSGSRWLQPFQTTLQHTRTWMREVGMALGTGDPRDAWHALQAVLGTLRDQLPVAEVADLAAALPLPLRGLLLEGWSGQLARVEDRAAFLAEIERRLGSEARVEPEVALHAVMSTLRRRVANGEMADMESVLPGPLKRLVDA